MPEYREPISGNLKGKFAQPLTVEIEIVDAPRECRGGTKAREIGHDDADPGRASSDLAREEIKPVVVTAKSMHQNHRSAARIAILPRSGVSSKGRNEKVWQCVGHVSSVAVRPTDVGACR